MAMVPQKPKGKSVLREYVEAIGIALTVALFLRFFLVEAFKIPSGSMVATLLVGDHIFVNKLSYRTELPYDLLGVELPMGGTTLFEWGEPEPGDVIVFRYPVDPSIDYIKRVVGVPGDRIEVRDNRLYRNNRPVPRSYVESYDWADHNCLGRQASRFREQIGEREFDVLTTRGGGPLRNTAPIEVKPGHVFVMGDNRDNSSDSRAWGQVPYDHIKGRAMFIWLSLDHCADISNRVRLDRFGDGLDNPSDLAVDGSVRESG